MKVKSIAIISTFSRLPFVIKIFVLSIFEIAFLAWNCQDFVINSKTRLKWPLKKKTQIGFLRPIIA